MTDLQYPFPLVVNPHANMIEDQMNRWIAGYRFCGPDFKERLRRANLGFLAACFWPQAPYDRLIPLARWLLWTLIYDDFWGANTVSELCYSRDRHLAILGGAVPVAGDHEILAALFRCREELLPFITPQWLERFTQEHEDYLEAIILERAHSHRADVVYMPLQQYIPFRRAISLVGAAANLSEVELDFILPDPVVTHPFFQRLRILVIDLICWSNDLFSVQKDLRTNEATNLVLVIREEQQCTLEEAYELAVQLHDRSLDELVQLSGAVPNVGVCQEQAGRFVNNMGLMVRGHLFWYTKNTRYDCPA